MSAEDKLRRLLQSEAAAVHPGGDGLARIQARLARRRLVRRWLVPASALATAGAVVTALLVLPSDRTGRPDVLVPGTPSPSPSATASPTTAPQPGDWAGPAFWPYSSRNDVDTAGTPVPDWVQDPVEVGRRLVRDVLQLEGISVVQECVSCEVLDLLVEDRSVGQVQLGHYTTGGKRVFTAVGIEGTDLVITWPTAGTAVPSPLTVRGTVPGVDESVLLRLVSRAGDGLAQASVAAGGEAPWSGSLTWRATDWDSGAVLAVTRSPKDGAVRAIALVPVHRGTAETTAAFAGLVDGHVSLYSAVDGSLVRRLTFPPAGKTDVEATWSAGTLVWVRRGAAGTCTAELDRLDGQGASTVVPSGRASLSSPQLSPSAAWLAWVEEPCGGGDGGVLVVTVGGTEARRMTTPTGSLTRVLDVRDDGTLLVLTNDREATGPGAIGVLPARATALTELVPLEAEPGCYLASGAAFDGEGAVAFQGCEDGTQLLRFALSGQVAAKDPALAEEAPLSVSVRDREVLVWRNGGDTVGAIARYTDGRLVDLTHPDPVRCQSDGDQRGCVRAPDW